jgi:hypothetical protein
VLLASVAALAPILVNVAYPVVPLVPQPDARLCERVMRWHRSSGVRESHPRIFATHPLIYYYFDAKLEGTTRDLVRNPPPGSIFVYDSLYGSYNSDTNRVIDMAMFEAAGWTIAPGTEDLTLPTQTWRIYLSPRPLEGVTP